MMKGADHTQQTNITDTTGGRLDEIIMESVLGSTCTEDNYRGFMSQYFTKLLRRELQDPIPERILRKDRYRAIGPKSVNWEKLAGWSVTCEPGGGHSRLERLSAEFYRFGILVPKSSLVGEGYLVYRTYGEERLNCLVRRRYRPETNEYEEEDALFASEIDAQTFCYFYNQKEITPVARIAKLTRRERYGPVNEEEILPRKVETGKNWITAVPI